MLNYQAPEGIWLPLITPFHQGEVDVPSLQKLIGHYASLNVSGYILGATTGEGQTLSRDELQLVCESAFSTLSDIGTKKPVFCALAGSDPVKIATQIQETSQWPVDGYLITSPLYLRPSQAGIVEYFRHVASATDRPIILYNIPYRTGVNMENDTMFSLASIQNIVGVKDCCGNMQQSYDLLQNAPDGFSVLTGEDGFFHEAIVNGGRGAILTGAHVLLDTHMRIIDAVLTRDMEAAEKEWAKIVHVPELLFAEPSPSPVKYWLWKTGLINSPETRLPFLPIARELAERIEEAIGNGW